jgi:hypothetical protein
VIYKLDNKFTSGSDDVTALDFSIASVVCRHDINHDKTIFDT